MSPPPAALTFLPNARTNTPAVVNTLTRWLIRVGDVDLAAVDRDTELGSSAARPRRRRCRPRSPRRRCRRTASRRRPCRTRGRTATSARRPAPAETSTAAQVARAIRSRRRDGRQAGVEPVDIRDPPRTARSPSGGSGRPPIAYAWSTGVAHRKSRRAAAHEDTTGISSPGRGPLHRPRHPLRVGDAARGQRPRRPRRPRAARARAPRPDRRAVARPAPGPRDSRALIRQGGDALFDADGPRVLAVGEVLPELPTASRRRAPGLPVDVARTVEELMGGRAARRRPRPRAVRALDRRGRPAPLARAERRHVPRPRRAARLDAGGAPDRRAAVRPPRRAHRELPDDRQAHRRARSPATTAWCCPAPTSLDPAPAGEPRADRVQRRGGARRAADLPARAAPPRRRRGRGRRRS